MAGVDWGQCAKMTQLHAVSPGHTKLCFGGGLGTILGLRRHRYHDVRFVCICAICIHQLRCFLESESPSSFPQVLSKRRVGDKETHGSSSSSEYEKSEAGGLKARSRRGGWGTDAAVAEWRNENSQFNAVVNRNLSVPSLSQVTWSGQSVCGVNSLRQNKNETLFLQ